jgi:hypothetical protein
MSETDLQILTLYIGEKKVQNENSKLADFRRVGSKMVQDEGSRYADHVQMITL